jgi:hypothetical protein
MPRVSLVGSLRDPLVNLSEDRCHISSLRHVVANFYWLLVAYVIHHVGLRLLQILRQRLSLRQLRLFRGRTLPTQIIRQLMHRTLYRVCHRWQLTVLHLLNLRHLIIRTLAVAGHIQSEHSLVRNQNLGR